jgi:hypothetical protein
MKFKLVEDREICNLTELLSDSDFEDPIRMRIVVTKDNHLLSDEEIATVSECLPSVSLNVEVLVDESDGTYQVCVPGKHDWIKAINKSLSNTIDNIIIKLG